MNCDRCQKLYLLKLDGQLSPDQGKQVQQHIERCPSCQKEIRQFQALYSELEKEKNFSPSEPILQKIRQEAGQYLLSLENKTSSYLPRVPVLLPRFAYALAVMAGIFFLISIFLPTMERWQMSRLKTESPFVLPQKTSQADFEETEKNFRDVYLVKVKKNAENTFSIFDKTVSLAKISSEKYYFSFTLPIKNSQDTIKDLESQVAEII